MKRVIKDFRSELNGLKDIDDAKIEKKLITLPIVYLKSEEMHVSKQPEVISTVLGSCIAVTMYNSRKKIGAMCHALLPVCAGKKECTPQCATKYKYVECVIPEMVKELLRLGIGKNEIEVKLFGGADMAIPKPRRIATHGVGKQNSITAVETIRSQQLIVKVSDVGGDFGRKLFFFTDTGKILMKRLNTE